MERIYENEMEFGKELVKMESQICDFVSRLEEGQYKVILYNGQTPITKDDLGLVECIVDYLYEESKVELKNNDTLVIHTENEIIELTGRKRMSDGEIFARKYLDQCECTGSLIVKDSLEQMELREDNIKDSKDYYRKCKSIASIRIVLEDDKNYAMNWDAIIIGFRSGSNEIWQRG